MTNINVLAKALNGKVINNRIYLDCDLPAHEQQAYLDFDHGSASLSMYSLPSLIVHRHGDYGRVNIVNIDYLNLSLKNQISMSQQELLNDYAK